jgi:hypothetical protein
MLAFKLGLGYGFRNGIGGSGVTHYWNDWTTRTERKAARETIEKENVAFFETQPLSFELLH